MLQRLGYILLFAGFVAVVLSAAAFVFGIKPEHRRSSTKPSDYGLDYERVTLTTQDGIELVGWFIPNPNSRALVIVGHGYPYDKGNILNHTLFLQPYFNLFYFDFRYFGESQGQYTTLGMKETMDVSAAMAYVLQRPEIDPDRIGMYGFSLSGSVFLQACPIQVRAIVVDSPFMDLKTVLEDTIPFFPGPLKWPWMGLMRLYTRIFLGFNIDEVSALKAVGKLRCPVLFIHGEKDSQVPARHSRALYTACGSRDKTYWLIPGADHNQTRRMNPEQYDQRVVEFFRRSLLASDAAATQRNIKPESKRGVPGDQ